MLMQQQSNEELCNLLIQSLIARDEKLLQKVLEQKDEVVIKDIINRIPVNHVRKLVIELRNILSTKIAINHLQWLQHLLALKYSVVSTMADGRSILIPLLSLLDDKSSPAYYNKIQGLKGKLTLLKQLKELRRIDMAETVVRVEAEHDQPAQMEVDSETDTESEEELLDENNDGLEDEGEDDELDDEDGDEALSDNDNGSEEL